MSSQGPLSDLTVVEMTAHRAGPFCGAPLADLGAEVVQIERPGAGEQTTLDDWRAEGAWRGRDE